MKGQTAIPKEAYLIAPIVEFDEEKKKIANQMSSLMFIVAPIAISFKFFNNTPWIIVGLILTLGCLIAGLVGMFGIKVYRETGLIELSKEHFSVIKNGEETKIKWSEPDAVSLVYLTDSQGESKLITNQIERCWIGYRLNNKTHYYYYLLTFGEMGRSIFKLVKELNNAYPNVKTLNSFGNNYDALIEKEKEKYKRKITSYNTAQA